MVKAIAFCSGSTYLMNDEAQSCHISRCPRNERKGQERQWGKRVSLDVVKVAPATEPWSWSVQNPSYTMVSVTGTYLTRDPLAVVERQEILPTQRRRAGAGLNLANLYQRRQQRPSSHLTHMKCTVNLDCGRKTWKATNHEFVQGWTSCSQPQFIISVSPSGFKE